MKVREVLNLLNKDGWTVKDTKGSHSQLTHPTKPGKVTLPTTKETYHRAHLIVFGSRQG